MPKPPKNLRQFEGLLKVVEFLRGSEGCPWDKEQTHETLTRYAIEEAHELAEAIDSGDQAEIRDELGDVLLQVVLNAEIARQDGRFDIHDVIESIGNKMVRRHPHVFGDLKVEDSATVLKNWSEIKATEKAPSAKNQPLTFDIPVAMPALIRAQKIGEKTKKFAFDWKDAKACWPKIKEEIGELEAALAEGHTADVQAELGDVLFSLAQLARHLNMDSEQALRQTNHRFETRFHKMQRLVQEDGKIWDKISAAEKESYWKRAKN